MNTEQQLTLRQQRERDFYDEYSDIVGLPEVNFDPVAGHEQRPWNSYWAVYQLAQEYYDAGARDLLDFGCGTGGPSMCFARIGYEVKGFDISPGNVHKAQELAVRYGYQERTEFDVQVAEHLDYADESFDIVVGIDVLHHIDIGPAVSETMRVLRPGGVAVFREHIEVPLFDAIRQSRMVRYWFPNDASMGHDSHITEDERKLNRADIRLIRERCAALEIRRFRVFSRLTKFWRKPENPRASLLDRFDFTLIKVLPFFARFGGSVVLILHNRAPQ